MNERLQPGIDLVTEHYGEDWYERIDVDALNMASWTRCVLGQLEGSYSLAALKFDFSRNGRLADAFNAHHPNLAPALTEAWRDVIRERRAAMVVAV